MTTAHHVEAIDRSVEKTHLWLKELGDECGGCDQREALQVLRAFLHALRDRLSAAEAAQLAAQLPTFIRGIFYEGWDPSRAPERYRDLTTFLERIGREARLAGPTETSFAAAAAARVLARHLSEGETESVLHVLPAHVRSLLVPEG